MIKIILLFCAVALFRMWKMDNAREKTRYTPTTEFAATKNLLEDDIYKLNPLKKKSTTPREMVCMYVCMYN